MSHHLRMEYCNAIKYRSDITTLDFKMCFEFFVPTSATSGKKW